MTLVKLFEAFKLGGFYKPIFISFSSNFSDYARQPWETQSEAIMRLIAVQLGEYTADEALNIEVSEVDLDRNLGDNVVLLVDELNRLAPTLDLEATLLLRRLFLDKRHRYLVFSSHYPFELDQVQLDNDVVSSSTVEYLPSCKGIYTFNMSQATSSTALVELQSISEYCGGLTESQAAWFGYIPSIVITSMYPVSISLRSRFVLSQSSIPLESRQKLLIDFVDCSQESGMKSLLIIIKVVLFAVLVSSFHIHCAT